jgi:hypothetical protein
MNLHLLPVLQGFNLSEHMKFFIIFEQLLVFSNYQNVIFRFA